MNATSCLLRTMLLLVVTPAAGWSADDQWQVGIAPSFSSGKYGTDTRTEVLHTPITARRLFGDGDLTLVFPFTCITGNGAVTIVNESPVRKERSGSSEPPPDTPARTGSSERGVPTRDIPAPTRATGEASLRPGTGALAQEVTHCGMGDIVVRGRYYLLDERGWTPTIAVRAHLKAPTASPARGLGTGRPDEGIGVEVSRTLGRGVLAMVDGGYTVIGKPARVSFDNNWWYDVGIGQNLASGAVNLSVFFEESRAIVPGLVNTRDILAAATVTGASGWRVQVSGELGLSDGAPDHGITIGASRRF